MPMVEISSHHIFSSTNIMGIKELPKLSGYDRGVFYMEQVHGEISESDQIMFWLQNL